MGFRFRYAALLVLTGILGIGVRFAHLPWPHAVSKYGGPALWAIAIFWLVSAIVPQSAKPRRAVLALLIAFLVEFFKLVRTPALDAFRLTVSGKLLLGRFFSVRDLLAYTVAILLAAALDSTLLRRRRSAVR